MRTSAADSAVGIQRRNSLESVEHVRGEAKSSRCVGARWNTHLNAGEVESAASGWFLCSTSTRFRLSRSELSLPRLVFFLAGVVECQMGPVMLFEQAGPPF